jgi:hypothetical protein
MQPFSPAGGHSVRWVRTSLSEGVGGKMAIGGLPTSCRVAAATRLCVSRTWIGPSSPSGSTAGRCPGLLMGSTRAQPAVARAWASLVSLLPANRRKSTLNPMHTSAAAAAVADVVRARSDDRFPFKRDPP